MNLFDIIKRSDFSVITEGEVACCKYKPKSKNDNYQAVSLGPQSLIKIKNAHLIHELLQMPFNTLWQVYSDPFDADHKLELTACLQERSSSDDEIIYAYEQEKKESPILFDRRIKSGFRGDLEIRNKSNCIAYITCCRVKNHKQMLIDLCSGKGVELGPGLNPHILPSEKIEISYIEAQESKQWAKTYNASINTEEKKERSLTYIHGDIRNINDMVTKKVDFIYSNHVIEHLLNPVLVIKKSLNCLKVGGVFLGSVPACANTFDLRQKPTTIDDLLMLEKNDYKIAPAAFYEQWILLTEPRATIENLISRNYSIHITFWTVELLETLCKHLADSGLISKYSIMHEPNSKDIQFILHSTYINT